MCLQADAIDQVSAAVIFKGVYKLQKRVHLVLLVVIIIVQVYALRGILICIIKGVPEIVIANDLGPVILTHGTIFHPGFVHHIIGIKKVEIAQFLQLGEGAADHGFHSGEHLFASHKGAAPFKSFTEQPFRRLAVPYERMSSHGVLVLFSPLHDGKRFFIELDHRLPGLLALSLVEYTFRLHGILHGKTVELTQQKLRCSFVFDHRRGDTGADLHVVRRENRFQALVSVFSGTGTAPGNEQCKNAQDA